MDKKESARATVVDLTGEDELEDDGQHHSNAPPRKRSAHENLEVAYKKQRPKSATASGLGPAAAAAAAPIKLFATLSDEEERSKSSDPEHWSRTQCWTLREMLGFDGNYRDGVSIEWLVVSNFLIDFEFFLNEIPEFLSISRAVVFYGSADTSFDPWKLASPGCVDFILLNPKDPPGPTNPTDNAIPYGVHHTKMFLVGFSDGSLRVVIHTANLRHNDVHLKAQTAYCQDFPPKNRAGSGVASASTNFEDDLVAYLETYSYNKRQRWGSASSEESLTLTERIRRYDFSSASAVIIASTPGYHKINGNALGHLKLREAVAANTPDPGNYNQNRPIVCQFSSIGSLSEKYLMELQRSMDTGLSRRRLAPAKPYGRGRPATGNPHESTGAVSLRQLQLVYPTVEEVRSSVEGYRGGGSVPGSMKNLSKPFLRALYRKWSSSSSLSSTETTNPLWKGRNVPHLKTYYQLNSDRSSIDWIVIASHNLSAAAWGQVQNSKKYGEQRLFIRHWELGVFLSPQLLQGNRLVPWSPGLDAKTGDITVPLPFKANADTYQTEDQPWAVDVRNNSADRFGLYSAYE